MIEIRDHDLLLRDVRKVSRGRRRHHGSIGPGVVVEGRLGCRRAEQIERVGAVADAGLELVVIVGLNERTARHR